MKSILWIQLVVLCTTAVCKAQNYPHYTMFMFNKLLYNPGYAGSKDVTTVNVYGRKQWTGFDGAPAGGVVTIDGPVGSYMKPFRKVALGLALSTEKAGITQNSNIMGSYAYRIKVSGSSVLSLGLQAGATLYSANYSNLNPYDQNDPNINHGRDVSNKFMPNFGAGAYYSAKNYYAGFSVPFLLENKYDNSSTQGKQVRTYYLSGGYVFTLSPAVKLEPQVLARYAGNDVYHLPLNADFNLSCFFYERFMIGATYRTDESVEGILFLQITDRLCAGYSYDYSFTDLRRYSNGTHEFTVGFDLVRDKSRYMNPRFVKLF